MTKKQITIGLCILAALAGSILGGIHIARTYPYRENGKYYIPKEYGAIHLPGTLRFTGKSWDDVNADDPSLESFWTYNYENAAASSNKATEQLVMASLRQAGYTISYEQVIADPNMIQFDATNSRLNLTVAVGANCNRTCTFKPEGMQVQIMAALPVAKAHLEY